MTPSRVLIARSGLATPLGFLLRAVYGGRFLLQQLRLTARWVLTARETTNHSYEITALNRVHLIWFVAGALDVPPERVRELFEELEADDDLRSHLETAATAGPFRRVSDLTPVYGRRQAWYAFVRILRPAVVVETGIDKGLGSCVLAAAILRNGHGHLYAIDSAAHAGWLLSGAYAAVTTLLHRDAATAISELDRQVDLLIHDVHATADQELAEYAAVLTRSPRAVLLNDNAHSHGVLPELCQERGLRYYHFDDQPQGHPFPGSGLGLAIPAP